MNILFTIIVYTGIVLAIVQAYRIGILFFKIDAKIKNRPYMGLPKEWVNINVAEWFKGRYFDIFPVSLFLRKLDPERYSAYSEEVQQMFRKKFKYEIYFWTVFLFGLLLIRVPQFLAKP